MTSGIVAKTYKSSPERRSAREIPVQDAPAGQKPASTSHALVPIARGQTGQAKPYRIAHPAAPFLSQLAATRLGIAQTRRRRRASAAETLNSYASASKLGATPPMGTLARKSI